MNSIAKNNELNIYEKKTSIKKRNWEQYLKEIKIDTIQFYFNLKRRKNNELYMDMG